MVVIRLARVGSTHKPKYRITVADSRRARSKKFIEIIRHYDPLAKENNIKMDIDKAQDWINKGAQPSDRVKRLMKNYNPS